MSKKVTLTPEIETQLRTSLGDPAFDGSKVSIFEARSLSTEPIQRKGGFYNQAQTSVGTLTKMAAQVNAPGGAIPLQIMHETDILPVGKTFAAKLVDEVETGVTALHTLFFVPNDQTDLLSKLDNAVVDEVSVGFLAEKALCSECNFDYFGEDSSIMNMLMLECENEHAIGQDGVHVNLIGLKDFAELSLVGRGAAKNPKILARAKQAMSEDKMKALAAASGKPVEAMYFTGNYKMDKPQGDLPMDSKELMAVLTAKSDEAAGFKVELTATKGEVTTLTATNVQLTADLVAKTAEFEALKAASTGNTEIAAKLTAAEATSKELKDVTEKLLPHVKAALAASGVAETDLSEKSITELVSLVEEKGLKLHQIVGVDPKSVTGKDGVKTAADLAAEHRKEAFKTNRN